MEYKLKFTDLIPIIGMINFVNRSSDYPLEETPSSRELTLRGINHLLLIGYNGNLLAGIIKMSSIEKFF